MSDKQETIADIIAEMRMGNTGPYPFAYLIGRAGGPLGNVIEQVTVKELADRLEAALKREREAITPKSEAIGNAAALREAVELARLYISLGPEAESRAYVKDGEAVMLFAIDVLDEISAALAAPPRNCERFATADDAKREFNYLWNFVWQRGGGCLAERNYEEEFERWLFAHATEKEGGAR